MPATIQFVDVGQGNCTLIVDHQGEGILVDCPTGQAEVAVKAARNLGLSSPATAFASHDDLDHIGAIVTVAQALGAREIRTNHTNVMPADRELRAKLRAILLQINDLDECGVPNRPAERDAHGNAGQISWSVLTPTHAQIGKARALSHPNHASMVLRVEAEGIVLLLPGDADGASFERMRADRCNITADILAVPHHGADVAPAGQVQSIGWILNAVGAAWCVVSCGPQSHYGHPTPATQAALGQPPVRDWWCTRPLNGRRGGSITILIDGTQLHVTQ